MTSPQSRLLNWYQIHHRDLPWRQTRNPYIIWLSEVILQQTRVEQGLPYFEKFMDRFPTLEKLASASEKEILFHWQGLGYYSRARNMHHTAKQVLSEYEGKFPNNYAELIKLKGIGPYTAAAIASFAFQEPVAAVDGNVIRVLTRYCAIHLSVQDTACKKLINKLSADFLNRKNPGLHNQAMMELGSLVCKPSKPLCSTCPLANSCIAFQTGKQELFPVKSKKTLVKPFFFYYFLFHCKGKIGLVHRKSGDIWQHLYDLPLISSDKELSIKDLRTKMRKTGWFGQGQAIKEVFRKRHLLSHRRIDAVFYVVDQGFMGSVDPAETWVKKQELQKLPVSRLLQIFFEEIPVF